MTCNVLKVVAILTPTFFRVVSEARNITYAPLIYDDDRSSSSDDTDAHWLYKEYGFPQDNHQFYDARYIDNDDKNKGYESNELNAYEKQAYNEYNIEKQYRKCIGGKSAECTAYFSGYLSYETYLFQTTNGQSPVMASDYSQLATVSAVFSNKARGSPCPSLDIEMAVDDVTSGNAFLSRFEAETSVDATTSRMYTHDTGLTSSDSFPLVTRIMIKRMSKIVDAYFLQFSFGYAQYDVKPLTNTKAALSMDQSICYDLAFFKNDHSRFICQGDFITGTTPYMRDPDTGVNFVPPSSNNPFNEGFGVWYTAVKLCKHTYIASVGFSDQGLIIARAKLSLKYPYFEDSKELFVLAGVQPTQNVYIYTPAHTDVIYVCYDGVFIRFDDAYTATPPLTPSGGFRTFGNPCKQLVSFKECPNEVYIVDTEGSIFYSNDGGNNFAQISSDPNIQSITGFAKPITDYN